MKYQINEDNIIIGILFQEDLDVNLDIDINIGLDKYVEGEVIKISGQALIDYKNREQQSSKPSYENLVEQYIRERYTVSQEIAILRQRDNKQQEFAEYSAYCEQCKTRAKEVII